MSNVSNGRSRFRTCDPSPRGDGQKNGFRSGFDHLADSTDSITALRMAIAVRRMHIAVDREASE